MFEAAGLCPVPGDSHLAEYLPWCHDPQTRPWEKYDLYLYDWEEARKRRDRKWQAIEAMALLKTRRIIPILRPFLTNRNHHRIRANAIIALYPFHSLEFHKMIFIKIRSIIGLGP